MLSHASLTTKKKSSKSYIESYIKPSITKHIPNLLEFEAIIVLHILIVLNNEME
jgi:hypothetical protein